MNGLPKSFLVVLPFAVLAIGLILYFASKQLRFRGHKRGGEEALKDGDHAAALQHFCQAEAVWGLNVTRQTTQSYQRDLSLLEEVLNGLQTAASAEGIILALDEYRDAVKAVHSELQGNEANGRRSSGTTYASAFTRLKISRSRLREELRAINSKERVKK